MSVVQKARQNEDDYLKRYGPPFAVGPPQRNIVATGGHKCHTKDCDWEEGFESTFIACSVCGKVQKLIRYVFLTIV